MFKNKIIVFLILLTSIFFPNIVSAATTTTTCGATVSNGTPTTTTPTTIATVNNIYTIGNIYSVAVSNLPFAIPINGALQVQSGTNIIYYTTSSSYPVGYTGNINIIPIYQTGPVSGSLTLQSASGAITGLYPQMSGNTNNVINSTSGTHVYTFPAASTINIAGGTIVIFQGTPGISGTPQVYAKLSTDIHPGDTSASYTVVATSGSPNSTFGNATMNLLVSNLFPGSPQCVNTVIPATSNIFVTNPALGIYSIGFLGGSQNIVGNGTQYYFKTNGDQHTANDFSGVTYNLPGTAQHLADQGNVNAPITSGAALNGQAIRNLTVACEPYITTQGANSVYSGQGDPLSTPAVNGITGGTVTLYDYSIYGVATVITSVTLPSLAPGGALTYGNNTATTTLSTPYVVPAADVVYGDVTSIVVDSQGNTRNYWTNCAFSFGAS